MRAPHRCVSRGWFIQFRTVVQGFVGKLPVFGGMKKGKLHPPKIRRLSGNKPIDNGFGQYIWDMIRMVWLLLVLVGIAGPVRAQEPPSGGKKAVQLSGLTLSEDSLDVIPYVTILVKNRFKGTISDVRGFFSLVALEGDSLVFSSVGYRAYPLYITSGMVNDPLFSVLIPMERDTMQLPEALIYPWPSREAFRQEFMALQLKDDAKTLAARNLEAELMRQLAGAMQMDASENQKLYMQRVIAQTYYAGGQQAFFPSGPGMNGVPIPSSLVNPLAWAEFIKAIRRGDFKRKE